MNRETSEAPAVQPDSRAVGEGLGHTARMNVSAESHSGELPMSHLSHSNKDKRSSAESEEGRPLIKENAGQPHTYATQSGKGVSQARVTALLPNTALKDWRANLSARR